MNNSVDFKHISMHQVPEQSPGFLLLHISTSWRTSIEKALKEFGLTHPQFVVLATLAWLTQNGDRVTQVEIGRTAGLDPNTTSQIVRLLEAKKYIKRVRPDERSKNPMLTELGAKTLKVALPAVEKVDTSFFTSLEPQELDVLVPLFQKLYRKR